MKTCASAAGGSSIGSSLWRKDRRLLPNVTVCGGDFSATFTFIDLRCFPILFFPVSLSIFFCEHKDDQPRYLPRRHGHAPILLECRLGLMALLYETGCGRMYLYGLLIFSGRLFRHQFYDVVREAGRQTHPLF